MQLSDEPEQRMKQVASNIQMAGSKGIRIDWKP